MTQTTILKIKESLQEANWSLQRADELLEQTFSFTNTWDMERCAKKYHLKEIKWDETPNKDPEWTYMLNRMTFLPDLLFATIVSDDIRYLHKAWALIHEWIEDHPRITNRESTRTLDTAMRIVTWHELKPYFTYYGMSDHQAINDSILLQIQSIVDRTIPKYTLSNWGSIQTSAILYILGNMDHAMQEVYDWAHQEFLTQMKIQVYPDGLHWEQSTMYHVEVLMYAMKANTQLRNQDIQRILEAMAQALMMQRTPQNRIEMFGDSDNSDLTEMMTYCALYFQDGRYLQFGDKKYRYASYYQHPEAVYEWPIPKIPSSLNYDGIDSGMFTSRSSWEADAHFTMITNGSLGSAHGHADNNHISIYAQGDPLFVDSGRYTYREDDPLRCELKSMAAHNSVLIDDLRPSNPTGSWTYDNFVKPLKSTIRHDDKVHYYEGAILADTYAHTRKVLWSDKGYWVIVDRIDAQGEHNAQVVWQLDSSCTYDSGLITTASGHRYRLYHEGEIRIEDAVQSYHYNETNVHQRLIISKTFTDVLIHTTIVYPDTAQLSPLKIRQGLDHEVENEIANAFQIGEDQVFIVHQEIYKGNKIFYIHEQPFHAKAGVIGTSIHLLKF